MANLKIWYWLRKRQKNKYFLYFRIILNNTTTNNGHSVGITITDVSDWNQEKQTFNSSCRKHKQYNNLLFKLENELTNFYLSLDIQQSNKSAIDFYKMYLDKNKPIEKRTWIDVFNEYIELIKLRVDNKQVTYSSYESWYNKLKLLKKYLSYHKKENINIEDVNRGEYQKLHSYLNFVLGLKNNYISKVISNFKSVFNFAFENGYIKFNPFSNVSVKKIENEIIYLTQLEVQKIELFETQNTTLQKVRDFFLFQCYTGIDYVDLCQLQSESIKEIENKTWLVYHRQKTKNKPNQPPASVPLFLFPKAIDLIKKYEKVENMPKMTNQRLNFYLKVISEMVGIKKKLHTKLSRKTFAMHVRNNLGYSIDATAVMLGDKDLKIVQTHYTYANIDKVMSEIDKKSI